MTWALRTGLTLDDFNVHLAALEAAGLLGAVEEDGVTSGYFPDRVDNLPVDGAWEEVADRDWNAEWRRGLEPVRVGNIVIAPPWHATGADSEIVIEPAQAFGTGHHETTTGCLAVLQEHALAGSRLLDLGTGTGVLAIAAARLGATVVAVDVDPVAVRAAADNARNNAVDISIREGSLAAAGDDPFDVIVGNLDTRTICGMAAELAARLAAGGLLVASGVSREREHEAVAALTAAGLSVEVRPGHDWIVILATPSAP